MLLKGLVNSSLLSKDEPLTPNFDKVMGVIFLEGGLKIRTIGKKWTSHFWFLFFTTLSWFVMYRS